MRGVPAGLIDRPGGLAAGAVRRRIRKSFGRCCRVLSVKEDGRTEMVRPRIFQNCSQMRMQAVIRLCPLLRHPDHALPHCPQTHDPMTESVDQVVAGVLELPHVVSFRRLQAA